ncbi:MAG: sugar transferase [Phycisphaerales bacterium]|jgi:lipopolysaccharide/colanic/teichoic acid biosynthesis glycosyltransferase
MSPDPSRSPIEPSDPLKRVFDLAVSATLLLVLSPLLVVIAIAVATTSPGGALFRQDRVGRGGRPFRIVKFRTMTHASGTEKGSFEPGSTARVTSIGRVLRATKLDELPQLWNVLRGEMSLVGPRPEVPRWTQVHRERWAEVLRVRPGITDPASLEFRDEERILAAKPDPEAAYRDEILPRKLELAERYVRERSFVGDLAILARTAMAIFRRAAPPDTLVDSGESR